MKHSIRMLGALSLSLIAASVLAEEDGWSGKGEAGISLVGGNSESEIITAGLQLGKKVGKWEHNAELSILKSESEFVDDTGAKETRETADSLLAGWISKYTFSKRTFAYGDLRYLDDKFDSFDAVVTVSAGLGYKVLMREDVKWDVSLGLGYRDTEYDGDIPDAVLEADGLDRDIGEATLVASSMYKNQLTDTTLFTNDTRIEGASDNSYAQNVTALSVKMTDALALSVKHDVRHNTDPAPGSTSTDRITSFNVVYSF